MGASLIHLLPTREIIPTIKGKEDELLKTKHYEFTEVEMLAIRDTLIEENQRLKAVKPNSPIFVKIKKAVGILKDQFVRDCQK